MKVRNLIAGLVLVVASSMGAGAAFADDVDVTITGSVVRYEPGRTIVIRGEDQKEVTYTLAPGIVVPSDVRVGGMVTLYTEPSDAGVVVEKVVTTSVTPEGNVQKTTETTRTSPSGMTTKTTTTEITGTVETYQPGRTLTLVRSDGTKVTYMINASSQIPSDLVVGKTISVVPVSTSDPKVVRTITYVTVPPSQ
jgi:hypothetical protein